MITTVITFLLLKFRVDTRTGLSNIWNIRLRCENNFGLRLYKDITIKSFQIVEDVKIKY
jgi:hypothetical protein